MPELHSAPLFALCGALLLAALGLVLWQFAARQQSRRVSADFLARRIDNADLPAKVAVGPWHAAGNGLGAETPAGLAERLSGNPWMTDTSGKATSTTAAQPAPSRWTIPLPVWLEGIVSPRTLALGLAAIVLVTLVVAGVAGPLAAVAAAVVLLLGGVFAIWLRLQSVRRTLVRQLPGFIDAMVRLITIGNSTQAAFQLAIASTPQPLQGYLDRAASLVRASVDLDRALHQTAAQVRIDEMSLLASILGLGVRYGGRADLLLERVGAFMRDREQAENELRAMSAETRLSAWVLGLLPLAVCGFIIMINPDYFMRMWFDASGRWLIFTAVALQAIGVALLYRLARLS